MLFIAAPIAPACLSNLAPGAHIVALGLIGGGFECRARTVPADHCQRLRRPHPMLGIEIAQVELDELLFGRGDRRIWVLLALLNELLVAGLQVTAQVFANCSRGALIQGRDQAGHDSLTMARDGFEFAMLAVFAFEPVGEGLFGAHRLLDSKSCR